MRLKRCVFLPCLALACAVSTGLAHSQTTPAPDSSRTVRGWEGTITIPTYKLGPADPNPPFPLISQFPIYPYTMLDDLTNNRVPVTYRAIYLENKYLKIIILPQLGGHVYSVYDKIDSREVLFHYNVIKYSLVAIRGAWIPSGMEFSFPLAHTAITVSPVESCCAIIPTAALPRWSGRSIGSPTCTGRSRSPCDPIRRAWRKA